MVVRDYSRNITVFECFLFSPKCSLSVAMATNQSDLDKILLDGRGL